MSEAIKLLESTEKKIHKQKHKYGENMPNLAITEVVLVHRNSVNNRYQNSKLLEMEDEVQWLSSINIKK